MVYLEAQAQGCPVLAEDRPGVREVVRDGGWLVPAGKPSAPTQKRSTRLSPNANARLAAGRKGRAQIAADHLLRRGARYAHGRARAAAHGTTPLIAARLALLRHGHTAWNRAGRIQGRIDEPLDEQAREHLSGLRLPDAFDGAAIYFKSACRARSKRRASSADATCRCAALIEMDWGGWEGQRGVDLLADPNSGYRHIEEWGWDFQPPGGETPRRVWERVRPWLGSLNGPAVVVSHIGIMRVLLARATGWNFDGPAPFRVKRDRLYRIDVHDDGTLSYDSEPVRLIEAGSP